MVFCTLPQSLSNLWKAIRRWLPSRNASSQEPVALEQVVVDPVTVSVTSEAKNDAVEAAPVAAPQANHMAHPAVKPDPVSASHLIMPADYQMDIENVKQPYHTWEECPKPATPDLVPSSAASSSSRGYFTNKVRPIRTASPTLSLDSVERF